VQLQPAQIAHRLSIWTACNIIAQSVSIGVGLGAPSHLHDWASVISSSNSSPLPEPLRQMLQIEFFRNEVIEAFAMNPTDENMVRPTTERLPIYKLFENRISKLEADLGPIDGKTLILRNNYHSTLTFAQAY
jgi:transcriptional regulatory protein LEU3